MKENTSIIWRQFKKRRIGYYSFVLIIVMFGIAIYAPFIANNMPYVMSAKYAYLYDYFYNAALENVTVLLDSLPKQDTLRDKEKEYLEGFNREKAILEQMNQELNRVGDQYDQLAKEITELETAISTARTEVDTDRLYQQKQALEEQRNAVGGEKARIQRDISEHVNIQNMQYNQPLVDVRYRLDFPRLLNNLKKSLRSMRLPVDDTVSASLERLYEKLPAQGAVTVAALAPIRRELATLDPAGVRPHLEYKLLFPVLYSLDLLSIFLMLFFVFILALVLFAPHYLLRARFLLSVALGLFLAALVIYLLIPVLPYQNYKHVLEDNFNQGHDKAFAVFPPVPYGYNENNFVEAYQKPFFVQTDGMHSRHILGTDDNGRDMLSRMIWGSRVSLSVGFVAVGIYTLIGIAVGSLAGYYGGKVDILISRFIEIIMCFPAFFLILTVIAFIGPSIYNIMVVIGILRWTGIARLIRGEFLRIKGLDYVQAARALGAGSYRIISKAIIPNALTPVLVSAAFGFAGAILTEASLSFLGFGVQEPNPSWGQMLSASKGNPLLYWWMFIIPGFALFITVTLYNLVGNTLRDAIDPRLRM